MKSTVTFGPFEGDREEKSADVFVNGVRVGWINKTFNDVFENRASMKRVWRFSHAELVLQDRDDEFEWHAPKWDATGASKVARAKARELLER